MWTGRPRACPHLPAADRRVAGVMRPGIRLRSTSSINGCWRIVGCDRSRWRREAASSAEHRVRANAPRSFCFGIIALKGRAARRRAVAACARGACLCTFPGKNDKEPIDARGVRDRALRHWFVSVSCRPKFTAVGSLRLRLVLCGSRHALSSREHSHAALFIGTSAAQGSGWQKRAVELYAAAL